MDLPILKYLDVLIGLSLVMLLGCSVVTAVTHFLMSAFYRRAWDLRLGLRELITELDPPGLQQHADYIAKLILRHPLLGRPTSTLGIVTGWLRENAGRGEWLPPSAPASTIQRHELLGILLEWAAGEGPLAHELGKRESAASQTSPGASGQTTPSAAREPAPGVTEAIRRALEKNGVEFPREAMRAVRQQAVENERSMPDQPAHTWHTRAWMTACPGDFVGKLSQWFDNTMSRVTQRFALEAKILGSAVALLVVLALPLDSLDLIKRLSVDGKLRDQYVAQALELEKKAQPSQELSDLKDLASTPVLQISTHAGPLSCFSAGCEPARLWPHVPGYILSWVLLSLGAPFWFDILKNATRLRSVLAQKDDKERRERERSAPAPAPQNPAPPPSREVAVTAVPVEDDQDRTA